MNIANSYLIPESTELDFNSLVCLPSLESVVAYSNSLVSWESLKSNLELEKLTNLDLANTRITEVNENSFRNLFNLISLDLSLNLMQKLPEDSFKDLKTLKSLNILNNTLLNKVDKYALRGLQNIETFYIDDISFSLLDLTQLPFSLNFVIKVKNH